MRKIASVFICFVISLALSTDSFANSLNHNETLSQELVESAIAYASNNSVHEISSIKTALDFSGNKYTIVECKPTGYMILHNETGDYAEYSMTSPSPYLNYTSNLYYAGFAQFYYKENNAFIHTITGETITNISNVINECSDISESFKRRTVQSYLNELNTASTTTYVPSYTWLSNANTKARTGYRDGGCCGYIAANLLMFYYEKTLSGNWVDSAYITNGYLNGSGLTDKLIAVGTDLGYTDLSTWAYDIYQILLSYLNEQGVYANVSWMFGGASNIYTGVDLGRPVIVFGSLTSANGGSNINHAVLAYGYDSSGGIIVHYGWSGYSQVVLGSGNLIASVCSVTAL